MWRRPSSFVRRTVASCAGASRGPTVGADGRLVGILTLPVDEVPQGDYELVLRVEDKTTGQVRERTEPLRIGSRSS
jgi:hypothetical protein